MRALALLLCLLSAQAWGATTYHLCPDTDASNVDLNYGTENGSSEANCYDGFADASTTGVVTAGDTIVLHGTFYNERGYAWVSGTSGAPITFQCGSDCLFFFTNSVAGSYTTATTPFGQGTGSSWQLVSGTTNIYKKGVGAGPFAMWVNGTRIDNAPTIPATANDAGAIAAFTADNQFTSVVATTDGFTRTLYFKGALTDDMRVNNQSAYTQADSMGGFVINGLSYITLDGIKVKGYWPNVAEQGALFVQNCTGCSVTGPTLWENNTGMRIQNNTNLMVSGTTANACTVTQNQYAGISMSGQYTITNSSTRAPLLITAISNVAGTTPGGQIDTAAAHGLTNGEVVVMGQATGLTALNGVEKTVTVVDADSFTIATDTSAMGTYNANTGILYVQRTDTNTLLKNCDVTYNGNYPRYNTTSISFAQDADGFGVGYFGGTINGLKVRGNRFWHNGPRRGLNAEEAGDTNRGSGFLVSTSYTLAVSNLVVESNDFYGNHRYSSNITDTLSARISGNLFRGVVNYGATPAAAGQLKVTSVTGTNPYIVVDNTFDGESGSYGYQTSNTDASNTFTIRNNLFGNLTKSADAATWQGSLYVGSSTANIAESYNKFLSAPSDNFYKRVGTNYTTVSAWQAASSQGSNDEIISDAGWTGGTSPTTAAGFCLTPDSPLLAAGTYIGAYATGFNNEDLGKPPAIGARGTCLGRKISNTRPNR